MEHVTILNNRNCLYLKTVIIIFKQTNSFLYVSVWLSVFLCACLFGLILRTIGQILWSFLSSLKHFWKALGVINYDKRELNSGNNSEATQRKTSDLSFFFSFCCLNYYRYSITLYGRIAEHITFHDMCTCL